MWSCVALGLSFVSFCVAVVMVAASRFYAVQSRSRRAVTNVPVASAVQHRSPTHRSEGTVLALVDAAARAGEPEALRPDTPDCTICKTALEGGCLTLHCGHMFHTACIVRWTLSNPTCPLCRAPVHGEETEPSTPRLEASLPLGSESQAGWSRRV